MSRLEDLIAFLDYDRTNGFLVEPGNRLPSLKERLLDVMNIYKPATIVKAGLGRGELLREIALAGGETVTVVEPSMAAITDFTTKYAADPILDKIRFINGDFTLFPVDYFSVDLLVCIDYLDILESGSVIDEFRRALQFEGVLFLGTAVLADDDLEGVFDDYTRLLFPLHNDYYLQGDLKTFLDLNQFSFIKSNIEQFPEDLAAKAAFLGNLYKKENPEATAFLNEHLEEFKALYRLEGSSITVPYYTGVFMRNKPERPKG